MSLDKAWSPTRASDDPFWFGPYMFHLVILVVLDFLESFPSCFYVFVYYLISSIASTFVLAVSYPPNFCSSHHGEFSLVLLEYLPFKPFQSMVLRTFLCDCPKYVIICPLYVRVFISSVDREFLRGRDHIHFPVVMEHNWSINVMFYGMIYVINIENMSVSLFPGRMKVVGLSTKWMFQNI